MEKNRQMSFYITKKNKINPTPKVEQAYEPQ